MTVELTAPRETKVEYIDVRVRGRQGWATGAAEASRHFGVDLPSLEKRVMDKGILEEGKRSFPLSFTLPRGTAPSHTLSPAQARLVIDVHVAIPWWRDGKYSFVAPVRLPPPASIQRTPLVTRMPFDAAPGEPRMELSLASSTLVAGETIVGSCAVFHLPDTSDRTVTISFDPTVRMLSVGWSRPGETVGVGYRSTVTIPAGSSGQAVPFRIGMPKDITPSFKTATHEIAWHMTASLGSFFRGTKLSLRVPLTIVDERAATMLPALTLTPRVADERVVAAFERFAATRAMTVVVDELDRYPDEQPALVASVGDCELRVGYAYRGEQGTFLVGRVLYPPLGLGLDVTPSSGFRELFSRDIEIDVAAWDRAHHVDGREAAQVVPLLRAAIPGVAVGSLVRWSDDQLVTERSVGAVDDIVLARVVGALEVVAAAISQARRAIPLPGGITADVDKWRALADKLRGQLIVGDLSIRGGSLDLQPVEVGIGFNEEKKPIEMRATVGSPQGDQVEWTDRVRELMLKIRGDIPGVDFDHGVASGSVPIADGVDVTRVLELLHALRSIVAAQYEQAGPYR